MLTMSRTGPAPRRFNIMHGKSERRRYLRMYAEGKLGDVKAFFPRAEDKLRLRTTSLTMFLEMADGVDDATRARHRDHLDFPSGSKAAQRGRGGCRATHHQR